MPLYHFESRNKSSGPFMKHVQELSSVSIFEEYAQRVAEYPRRQFSCQGDVLDYSEGLQHSIRTSDRINPPLLQFYSGLPSVWFEMALCWTPVLTSKVHRRHVLYRQPSEIELPFPSWSWAGWIREIEYVSFAV